MGSVARMNLWACVEAGDVDQLNDLRAQQPEIFLPEALCKRQSDDSQIEGPYPMEAIILVASRPLRRARGDDLVAQQTKWTEFLKTFYQFISQDMAQGTPEQKLEFQQMEAQSWEQAARLLHTEKTQFFFFTLVELYQEHRKEELCGECYQKVLPLVTQMVHATALDAILPILRPVSQAILNESLYKLFSSPGKAKNREDLTRCFRMLTQEGADTCGSEHSMTWGDSLLLKAVRQGHRSGVQLILSESPVLLQQVHGETGATACHEACAQRMTDILEDLLQAGASPQQQDKEGNTPVHAVLSSQTGHLALSRTAADESERLLSLLAQHGASFTQANAAGDLPIQLPQANRTQIEWILCHVDQTTGQETVREMLTHVNGASWNALQCAAQHGAVDVVAYLCAWYQQLNIPMSLQEVPADDQGQTILHRCAGSEEHASLCGLLVSQAHCPVDQVDHQGRTPLHLAASLDNVDAVSSLLQHGASPTSLHQEGRTPIQEALRVVAVGSLYEFLTHCSDQVENEAWLGACHHQNGVPLIHRAVEVGQVDLVRELVLRGQDLSVAIESDGFEDDGTPLHFACRKGNAAMLDVLLAAAPSHMNLNSTQAYGRHTALHLACDMNAPECVKLLVRQPGIELAIKNGREETALELAQGEGNEECAQLIEQAQEERKAMQAMAAQGGRVLILGAGFVGHRLATLLWHYGCTVYQTHRTLPEQSPPRDRWHTLAFDLDKEETWSTLPHEVDWAILTMKMGSPTQVRAFHETYLQRQVKHVLAYGSTSRYKSFESHAVLTEEHELDLAQTRVQSEEFIRECGGMVLVLAGIYGEERQPRRWIVQGRIKDGRKHLNLIHVADILVVTCACMRQFQGGENVQVSDGAPRWVDDLAAAYGCSLPNQSETPPESKQVSSSKLQTFLPPGFAFVNILP